MKRAPGFIELSFITLRPNQYDCLVADSISKLNFLKSKLRYFDYNFIDVFLQGSKSITSCYRLREPDWDELLLEKC